MCNGIELGAFWATCTFKVSRTPLCGRIGMIGGVADGPGRVFGPYTTRLTKLSRVCPAPVSGQRQRLRLLLHWAFSTTTVKSFAMASPTVMAPAARSLFGGGVQLNVSGVLLSPEMPSVKAIADT